MFRACPTARSFSGSFWARAVRSGAVLRPSGRRSCGRSFSILSAPESESPDYTTLGTAFSRLTDESVIRVSGKDAAQFLQGLITQDVRDIVVKGSSYAGWLNNRGRLITTTLISTRPTGERPSTLVGAGPHEFLIQCSAAMAPQLARHMKLYTLRAKVAIEDFSEQLRPAAVFGPAADRFLASGAAATTVLEGIPAVVADPRHEHLGVRLLLPAEAAGAEADFLGSAGEAAAPTEVPVAVYRDWLCTQGVPCPARDVVPGESLPLNFNLDYLRGVSFEKGCYLGQELTARTHFQGLVRKRFMPFLLLDPNASQAAADSADSAEASLDNPLLRAGAAHILAGHKALAAADLAQALPERLFPFSHTDSLRLKPEVTRRLAEANPQGRQPLAIAGLRRGKPHTVGELSSLVGGVGAGELRLEGSVDWSATGSPPQLQLPVLPGGEAATQGDAGAAVESEAVAAVVPVIPTWWPGSWADHLKVEAASAD